MERLRGRSELRWAHRRALPFFVFPQSLSPHSESVGAGEEVVRTLQYMQKGHQAMQEANHELMKSIVVGRAAEQSEREVATDKMNALAGFEFKQSRSLT